MTLFIRIKKIYSHLDISKSIGIKTKNMKLIKSFLVIIGATLVVNVFGQADQFTIKNIDINTDQADFGTAYYKDKVVYVSTREGVKGIKRTWSGNSLPFLDMYITDLSSDNELSNRRQFRKNINKKFHDGPAAFSKNGDLMVFTRNNYDGKSSDDLVKLQLFYSDAQADGWTTPKGVNYNSWEYSVGQPALTADGKTMFFASDMPGGKGGVDIYRVNRNNDGTWGKPENLGDKINTSGKEMFPFIHSSGALIFASTSHGSTGGMDIFYCELKENGKMGPIKTFGEPINGPSDDFAMILNEDMTKGFFSSNRIGGKGDDDVYSFNMSKPLSFGKSIEGIAKDKDGNPISGTEIMLMDETGNVLETITTKDDGAYSFSADPDLKFKLVGKKDKYFDGANLASTFGDNDIIIADLMLEKDPGFSLFCLVTESGTGIPIENVKITLLNNMTDNSDDLVTDGTGSFRKGLVGKKINDRISYNLKFEKEGYLSKVETFNKLLDKPGQIDIHKELDISMDKIDVGTDIGKLININPIYFDVNKDFIRPDAAIELEKIVKVMNENPTLEIELGSHTDCRASANYNQKLSDRRAKSSAKYVKDKITNPDRIYGKGYGESKLVNKCECEGSKKVPCTEDEHQLNRRTEFTIVKM